MSFTQREARNLIRKATKRVPEGEEVRHLNIMPMMDMMTILLVAFIFQASVTTSSVTASQVQLARSLSEEPLPEGAATLIITPTAILVEDKAVVAVRDGAVDSGDLEGGALGMKISNLTRFLAGLHNGELEKLKLDGKDPPQVPELLVIADRNTPYRLLLQVLYSATAKEAGYKRFRMIVQKQVPGAK